MAVCNISIPKGNQTTFFEKPIKFYETGDNEELKTWLYETSIDRIDFKN